MQYSLYSQGELVKYVKGLVEVLDRQTYYGLNEYTLADYEVRWRKGEKEQPLLLSHYYNGNREKLPTEYRLSRIDFGPFSNSSLSDYLRTVDKFEIKFMIEQQFHNHSDIPQSCYQWEVRQQFDFSVRSVVTTTQVLTPFVCGGLYGRKLGRVHSALPVGRRVCRGFRATFSCSLVHRLRHTDAAHLPPAVFRLLARASPV